MTLNQNLPHLTSLRFFAAMWVVIFHFRPHLQIDLDSYTAFFLNGDLGVDLFFILSGFILGHVYASEFAEDRFSYATFLQKRVARIYPVHLVTLLAAVGIFLVADAASITIQSDYFTVDALLQNIFLVHAWNTTDSLSWNYPSWSVSAEAGAYLLFPLLFLIVFLPNARPKLTVFLALLFFPAAAITYQSLTGTQLTDLTWNGGILRILPEFVFGLAVYRLGSQVHISDRLVFAGLLVSFCWLLAALHFDLHDMYVVPVFGPLILLLAKLPPSKSSGHGVQRSLVYLGEISYSIYMVHALVAMTYFKAVKLAVSSDYVPVAFWLLAFVLVIMISAVTYHLIEVPGRRAIRRLGQRDVKNRVSG